MWQADLWRKPAVLRPPSPFAFHVANMLGYPLPMWKRPTLGPHAPLPLVRLNSHTGLPRADAGPLFIVQDIGSTTAPGILCH